MLQLSYNCEGRAFLRTESTKWDIDLMVRISAAILDHEVTWGRKTIEDAWAPAPTDHHSSFGLFLIFLKVRNKFLLYLSHYFFLFVFCYSLLNLIPSLSQSQIFLFSLCVHFFLNRVLSDMFSHLDGRVIKWPKLCPMPHNSYVEALTPQYVIILGDKVFKEVIKLK